MTQRKTPTFYKNVGTVLMSDITKEVTMTAQVLKADEDAKIVWGWAYVATVDGEVSLDHSGEYVSPETLVKAATNFMMNTRVSKVNHTGEKDGDIVHSLPVTKELAEALGIQTNREGWIIGVRVSPTTLQKVQSGLLTSFSIGGRALKRSL
jgi:hypothetical protein